MSARFTPLIFLCRMAVYLAALVVLATARLPREATASPQAMLASGAHSDAPETERDALGIRVVLSAVLLIGVILEARRPPWP